MTSDECFDILYEKWCEMGLSEEEIEEQKADCGNRVIQAKKRYLQMALEKLDDLKEKTAQKRETLMCVLRAMQAPNEEIEAFQQIEERAENWKQNEEQTDIFGRKYQSLIDKRMQEFETVFASVSNCFSSLGIGQEERGEFSEIGDVDLSEKRLKRFQEKEFELNEIYTKIKLQFEQKIEQIKLIMHSLGIAHDDEIDLLVHSTVLSAGTLQQADMLITQLNEKLDEKKKELSSMAFRLTSLWDVLGTPDAEKQPVLSQPDLSEASLQVVRDALVHYNAEKEARLEELIQLVSNEIKEHCTELHIPEAELNQILQKGEKNDSQYFEYLTNAVIVYRNLVFKEKSCLEMIGQREEIIQCYNEKPNDEKVKRRYKTVLPRLEKKLRVSLDEFYDNYKQPLMYDGRPYVNELSHVVLTSLERTSISKKRKSIH